jgi:hypothetical protein
MIAIALRRRETVHRTSRAWSLVLAVFACLVFSSTAGAQSNALGPGPFSRVELTDAGLKFAVDADRKGVPFNGTPVLLAADGNGFSNFGARARVERGGSRLVQRGEIAGQMLATFFAEGSPRFVQITNGDGRITQLEVIRTGGELAVVYLDRALLGSRFSFVSTTFENFDAREDRSAEVALPPGPASDSPSVAFTVAVSLPPLPEGASHQQVYVYEPSEILLGIDGVGSTSNRSDSLVFVHMTRPRGTYDFAMTHFIYFDATPTRSTWLSMSHDLATDLRIGKGDLVTYTSPPLPPLVETSVSFQGLEQFEPTASAPMTVSAILTGIGTPAYLQADVQLIAPSSPTMTFTLPVGEYETRVGVGIAGTGPNSGGNSASFATGIRTAEASMVFSIPPLARLTGTVLDPDFQLAPSRSSNGALASHSITFVAQTTDALRYDGSAQLLGFQRGFRMGAPTGSVGHLSGFFRVRLGDEPAPEDSAENDSGFLGLGVLSDELAVTSDREVNVTIPLLPRHVTVAGRVVDAKGRGVRYAYLVAHSTALAGLEDAELLAGVVADERGRFRLRLLPSENYTITVYAPLGRLVTARRQ